MTFAPQGTASIKDERATCLTVAPDGTVWAGTAQGNLLRGDQQGLATLQLGGKAEGKQINCLALDRRGSLWLGTQGSGLLRYTQGRVEVFDSQQGFAFAECFAIAP